MNSNNKIARAVGILYLAGMVAGVTGNIFIQSILTAADPLPAVSANSMKLAIGAMLMLMTSAWDASHGILMFPVLKPHSELIALGYLSFRIVNAVFLALQVLFILLQIPLGGEYLKTGTTDPSYLQALSTQFIQVNLYAYQIAMIFVGLASLLLCYMLYRARLLPRFLAVWGFVGYATILCGSLLEVMGFDLRLLHTIPGGLWELFIGVWLIVKGFNSPPVDQNTGG